MHTKINEYLSLIGISSLGLALLYISGFFTYIGESYLMGVYIPKSSFEYLLNGGVFLFQAIQSIIQIFQFSTWPTWIEDKNIGFYFLTALFISLIFITAMHKKFIESVTYFKEHQHIYWISARGCLVLAIIIFSISWLNFLTISFTYQDMLFPINPINPKSVQEKTELFNKISNSKLNASEKIKGKQVFLKSLLRNEYTKQKKLNNSHLENKIKNWLVWQRISKTQQSTSFGLFLLICLINMTHLIFLIKYSLFNNWFGKIVIPICCSFIIIFQLCVIPITFGIMFPNKEFKFAKIIKIDDNVAGAVSLKDRNVVILGESNERIYLYDYYDLWRIHVISSDSLKVFYLQGKKVSPLFWINDLDLNEENRNAR